MASCKWFCSLLTAGAVSGALLVGGLASGQTYDINFDSVGGVPISLGTTPYGGAPVSDFYSIPGVTWGNDTTADPNVTPQQDWIYEGTPGGQASDPNFASGFNDLGTFEIDFATPESYVAANSIAGSEYTLSAFDSSGNLLGQVNATSDFQETGVLFPDQISQVTFTPYNDPVNGINGYGFDNLVISSVPEPGAVALCAGMAVTGIGFSLRRMRIRRNRA